MADILTDMEVHMVANMEVDKVANKVADMVADMFADIVAKRGTQFGKKKKIFWIVSTHKNVKQKSVLSNLHILSWGENVLRNDKMNLN